MNWEIQLKKIQSFQQRGLYQKTFEQLNQFSDQLEEEIVGFKIFESFPSVDEKLIQMLTSFYLEYGLVTLKLSLLPLARKCVHQNNKLIRFFPAISHKVVIQNGLILAKIEYWLCRYSQASEILLAIKSYLEEHDDSLLNEKCEILQQLANTYRAWCKYELASKRIEEALQICSKFESQLDQLTVSNVIFVKARFLMDTDNSSQGIELALRCLNIRQDYYINLNPNHGDIALAQELVAKLYFSTGDVNNAEMYHNKAYENKMSIFGEFNFETVDSINERGRIMLSKKKIFFSHLLKLLRIGCNALLFSIRGDQSYSSWAMQLILSLVSQQFRLRTLQSRIV